MKTKQKVKFWLKLDHSLRDSDERLCANIWAKEIQNTIIIPHTIVNIFILK